ncbi:hypothetical protein MY10362_002654 [Beauveria mimosiformis]
MAWRRSAVAALPVQCLPASNERFVVRIVLADELKCCVSD